MAYMFQAAWLCDDCGKHMCRAMDMKGTPAYLRVDSDHYPIHYPASALSDVPNDESCDMHDKCVNRRQRRRRVSTNPVKYRTWYIGGLVKNE